MIGDEGRPPQTLRIKLNVSVFANSNSIIFGKVLEPTQPKYVYAK
jgi:hypothetical protein